MSKDASITLKNDVREVRRLSMVVNEFVEANDLSAEVAFALDLALEEVFTNVISYAYEGEGDHEIDVRLALEDGEVTVEVADDGRPFNPLEAPEPDLESSLEERPIGGLGLHLVRSVMDELAYRRDDNGNLLILRKAIHDGDAGDEQGHPQ